MHKVNRVISLIIIVMFFFTNSTYGVSMSTDDTLRQTSVGVSEHRGDEIADALSQDPGKTASSGISMRRDPGVTLSIVASGLISDIHGILDLMHNGYGERFKSVYDSVITRYPILNKASIIIQLVDNNPNLMGVKEGVISIDIDLFKSYGVEFEFEGLLEMELEEHMHHLVLMARKNNQGKTVSIAEWALEEVGTDHTKIRKFLAYSPRQKAEVLKVLMGDNDIDSGHFYETLVSSMSKEQLRDVISILQADPVMQHEVLREHLHGLQEIYKIADDKSLSSYDIFKLAITYARKDNIYHPSVHTLLLHMQDEEIILTLLNYKPELYMNMVEYMLQNHLFTGDALKSAVDASIQLVQDKVIQRALLFALPQEVISDHTAEVIRELKPSVAEREAALKTHVAEMEEVFNKCRTGETPSWGTIVITSTRDMTPMYEAYMKSMKGVLYPNGMRVEVLDESHLHIDFKCGNGGATATVFKYLKDTYGMQVFNEPVLIVHAGGFGQRFPESIAEGTKALTAVPRLLPNDQVSTNLAEAIRNTYTISAKIREVEGGVYITNCDGFLVYGADSINLRNDGVNIFTAPTNISRAIEQLGTAHDIDGVVDRFFEKKSIGINASGFSDYQEYIDTGYLPANTANYFFPIATIYPTIMIWDVLSQYRREIDTAGEMLTPLATGLTVELYEKAMGKGDFSREAFRLARRLGKAYNVYIGRDGMYDDTGDTLIYRDSVPSLLGRVFNWQRVLNVETTDDSSVAGVALDTKLTGASRIAKGAMVVGAKLHNSVVEEGSILYDGIGATIEGLMIGKGQSLFRVGIKGNGKWVPVWRLAHESPKNHTAWGMSIVEMCKKAGTYAELEEIALGAEKYPEQVTLWDAPLWPILSDTDSVQEALGWMSTGEEPSELYKNSDKRSMNWVRARYDYDRKIKSISTKTSSAGSAKVSSILDIDNIGSLTPEALARAVSFATGDLKDIYQHSKLITGIVSITDGVGTIGIDLNSQPENQRAEIAKLYDKDSPARKELERLTGCMIRLTTQLDPNEIKGRFILISDTRLPRYANAQYISPKNNIPKAANSYMPLVETIAIAKVLLSSDDVAYVVETLNRNDFYRSIFGQPLTKDLVERFLKTDIFELPIPRFDYNKVEMLQRQALAALISA